MLCWQKHFACRELVLLLTDAGAVWPSLSFDAELIHHFQPWRHRKDCHRPPPKAGCSLTFLTFSNVTFRNRERGEMALFHCSVFVPFPGFTELSLRIKRVRQNSSQQPGPQRHRQGSEGRAAGTRARRPGLPQPRAGLDPSADRLEEAPPKPSTTQQLAQQWPQRQTKLGASPPESLPRKYHAEGRASTIPPSTWKGSAPSVETE